MTKRNGRSPLSAFKTEDHPWINIQKEVCPSSWFGFSLILNSESRLKRQDAVRLFSENNIECRPIATVSFLKNTEVLEYFDYEVHGAMVNANYLDQNGLFVGNHHVDITREIDLLYSAINKSL